MAADSNKRFKQQVSLTSSVGSANSNNLQEDIPTNETPREFLNRCQANDLLHDTILSLLQDRPKDPIAFLAEHFGSLLEPKSILQSAYGKIRSSHYSKDTFEGNIVDAYKAFQEKKGKSGHKTNLQGEAHNELLIMLTKDLPIKHSEPLLKQLMKAEMQSVPFSTFRCDITTVCLCEDFIKTAESIYDDIDFNGTGNAPKDLCVLFLNELKSIVETGLFAPGFNKKLNQVILECSLIHDPKNKNIMKSVDFVQLALNIFINQL
eukprot:Seg2754.3 transcript_id=Seg2754.3/GoldUCD/mRNA.D3Y31 product="Tubulin polyglutamylase complex subunit 1" protein_id=Seg2754.3/GoldUCD/D3Y31